MLNKKGIKNINETGIPIKILFAKTKVFSKLRCSPYDIATEIKLMIGREIKNPAKEGFFKESQLANEMRRPEKITFKINSPIFKKLISQRNF